jgi:hypothetical protein
MTLTRTFVALCIASLGALGALYVVEILSGDVPRAPGFAIFGVFALISGLLFVFPVLLFVPRLRRPAIGVAALWGASVACAVAALLFFRQTHGSMWAVFAGAGAASGVMYAAVARRL